jgi:hypothetical protein
MALHRGRALLGEVEPLERGGGEITAVRLYCVGLELNRAVPYATVRGDNRAGKSKSNRDLIGVSRSEEALSKSSAVNLPTR